MVSSELTPCAEELVRDKVDKLYKKLRTKAVCVPGVDENTRMPEKPDWYDEAKFKRAQAYFKSYFTSLFLAHMAGLAIGFMMPSLVPPMAHTQSHSKVSRLWRRYFNTVLYIKLWYENLHYEEDGIAAQAFRKVNYLHKFIIKKINPPPAERKEDHPVWLSQYDMVLIEWSIIAPVLLNPKDCGIHDLTREQAEDLIHYWAIATYNVGIKEEFNILRSGNYDEAYYICKRLLDRDIRPVARELKSPADVGIEEGHKMTISLQPLCPIFSLSDLMRHYTRVWDIPVDIPVERPWYYMAIEFYTLTLCRFRVWHWIVNIVFRYIMYSKANNIDGIAEEFDKKYPDSFMPFELSNTLDPKSVLQY